MSKTSGLKIAVTLETAEIDEPLAQLKRIYGITTLITLLLALLLSIYYIKKLIRPVPLLQAWATEIAEVDNVSAKIKEITDNNAQLNEMSKKTYQATGISADGRAFNRSH